MMPAQQGTNGLAMTSMILGIAGIVLIWLPIVDFLGILGAIVAVILGHIGFSQINRPGNMQGGRGMAIAGFVLGYISIAIFVLVIIVLAAASSSQ